MATAYLMWSRAGVREDANGNLTWTDGYHIIDAADAAAARLATGLPRRNDTLAGYPSHRARSITVGSKDGPTQWLATVEYAIPDNGQFPDPVDDPLLRPFRWTVQPSYEERANEVDAKRRFKVNSAGDLFPPRSSRYRRRMIIGTRYEPFWNINKARKFENKTNSTPISLGPVVILPYECLCHAIEPVGEFESTAEYLLMQYMLEVAVDERATPQGDPNQPPISGYPFEQHQLDIGSFGWYDAGSIKRKGRFCYASGTTAASSGNFVYSDAEDVQLDGTGKPKDTNVYVRSDDGKLIYSPTTNPSVHEWLLGGTYQTGTAPTASPYSTTANPMWLFLNHVAINFADLFTLT